MNIDHNLLTGGILFVCFFLLELIKPLISKNSNRKRDKLFVDLGKKYNLSVSLTGSKFTVPNPPEEFYSELRKLMGVANGKKIIIQEIIVCSNKKAAPNTIFWKKEPITRFFTNGTFVHRDKDPEMDGLARYVEIENFLNLKI